MSHKDLWPENIVALADSREQTPVALDLSLPTEKATLYTGDYSVRGLENLICIERKSLPDLVGCVGRDRDRFERCIQRMKGYQTKVLVIEANLRALYLPGQWRGHVTPKQVFETVNSWAKHVSVYWAYDHQLAGEIISGILNSAAREHWGQLQGFFKSLKIASNDDEVAS